MMIKPPIIEVIGEHVPLRRVGKEWVGLCPFHSEKTPSLSVNDQKGLFYCFGCGESGDVIRFIEMVEKTDFKGALAFLNLKSTSRPRRSMERKAAGVITTWAKEMSLAISALMRDLGQRGHIVNAALSVQRADKVLLREELESLGRQWTILETLDDDLNDPNSLPEIWKERSLVEGLVHEFTL